MQLQNQNIDLLQEVYHSASMGERAAKLLLEKSMGGALNEKLSEFIEQYCTVKQDVAVELSAYGQTPQPAGAVENVAQWMGVQLGTLTDKSPSQMARMLIEGSTRSMVDSIVDIKHHPGADARARQLAGRLVRIETDSIDAMKTYLS